LGKRLGFEFDLGFIGVGDVDKKINPVRGWVVPAVQLFPGLTIYDAYVFLTVAGNLIGLIPIFGPLVKNKVIHPSRYFVRWRPETVYMIRCLTMITSLGMAKMTLKEMYKYLLALTSRLLISVNEEATIRANRGQKSPSKWRRLILFQETGIDGIFEKPFLTIIREVFDAIEIKIPARLKDEYDERKNKKGRTKLEQELILMYNIPDFIRRTVFFIERIIPMVGKVKMDKTDTRRLVNIAIGHANKAPKGILSEFKLLIMPDFRADIEEQEAADKAVIASQLGNAAEIVKKRLPITIKMLKKFEEKMAAANFEPKHLLRIAETKARMEEHLAKYKPILLKISWGPDLGEGETSDKFGQTETWADYGTPKGFEEERLSPMFAG